MEDLLIKVKEGFKSLAVRKEYQENAVIFLKQWLTGEDFKEYVPQICYLIETKQWDYLLDSFYQVIPFGTGGRRGEVGIGPNRINQWTIMSSAQGHSQFLLKKYGEDAKKRGVVFTWDVRQFFGNKNFNDKLFNPVMNLTGKDLAVSAAQVYAANGIKVFVFDDVRTTPELSFAIRHLEAIAGDMFSASHNPPSHNGKKVYDNFGGQLVPPEDEQLVEEVTKNVSKIETINYEKALEVGLIEVIGEEIDDAYIKAASSVSLSGERNIKIAFTPLHGCASTSVLKVLRLLGFEVFEDPKTNNPSGKFENVTFNIPNPEVEQSFETPLAFAKEIEADILLNSDPDADRIGIMVFHENDWKFLNGNEIGVLLTEYVIRKRNLPGEGICVKTIVTTNLIKEICEKNRIKLIGDLLVGFKYIGTEMNKLEESGQIDNFLFGSEESHGYIAGNYARDKDAVVAAVWLSELAAELKKQNKTLVDYLNDIFEKYGYFRNYLTEIRMLGATGVENIKKIQNSLRGKPPTNFGRFSVDSFEDFLNRKPIVSETDRASKDMMVFNIKPLEGTISLKITIRPSGTEPKIKMYFEIGAIPTNKDGLEEIKIKTEDLLKELEQEFMIECYNVLNIDFPKRGFFLFWQMPLEDKIRYFEVEREIENLREVEKEKRAESLSRLLSFLGSDPIQKVDAAFKAKNNKSIEDFLELP